MPAWDTREFPWLSPSISSKTFGEPHRAMQLPLRVSAAAEPREGTFTPMAVGPVSVWVTPPGCCGCCRECVTVTFISSPFKDTGGKR